MTGPLEVERDDRRRDRPTSIEHDAFAIEHAGAIEQFTCLVDGHERRRRLGDEAQVRAPGIFALAEPERIRILVTGAGFSEPLTEQVDFVFHHADEHDAWDAIVDLHGPLAVIIKALSDDERDAIRRVVLDGFGPYRDSDGSYRIRAQALAVHAN